MARRKTISRRTRTPEGHLWSLEFWCLFIFLVAMGTKFSPFPTDIETFFQTEDRNTTILTASFLAISAGLSLIRVYARGQMLRLLAFAFQAKALVLLTVLALASSLWSDFPTVTLMRGLSATAALITIMAFVVGTRDKSQLVRMTYDALLLIIIIGMIGVFFFPERAVHTRDSFAGLWRGMFGHKNYAGGVAATGLIMSIVLAFGLKGKVKYILGILIFSVFLLNSESKTALYASPLVILCCLFMRPYFMNKYIHGIVCVIVVLFCAFFAFFAVIYLAPLGITFTSRTNVWSAHWAYAMESPILGHGFQAVYSSDGEGGGIASTVKGFAALAGHAHNGFLEMFGQLGIVGLLLAIWMLVELLKRAYSVLCISTLADRPWVNAFFAVAIFGIIRATFEPDIMSVTRLHWLLLITALMVLADYFSFRAIERPVGRRCRKVPISRRGAQFGAAKLAGSRIAFAGDRT